MAASAAVVLIVLPAAAQPVPAQRADGPVAPGHMFIENLGQWDARVAFVAQRGPETAWLLRDGLVLRSASDPRRSGQASAVVQLTFRGAREDVQPVGERPDTARFNFFLGNDPSRWRAGARGFASVLYRDLYPAIDLRIRTDWARLEYDLLLGPGADLGAVVLQCDGNQHLELLDSGELLIQAGAGALVQPPPRCWEVLADGSGRRVEGRFRLIDATRFGFEVEGRSTSSTLVIDPGLEWSTYLGGSGGDLGKAIVFDPTGDVILVGETGSSDLPVTSGAFDESYNGPTSPNDTGDVFVTRFDRQTGGLVYSTFLGGSGGERISRAHVGEAGALTLCGTIVISPDFPVTPGSLAMPNASLGLFVTRFTPDGAALVFSAAFGGNNVDDPRGMAVTPEGDVIVGGLTGSSDFPVTPSAFDTSKGQQNDAFLLRLDSSGSSLDFCTYLGGDSSDVVDALALDPNGNILIAGGMTGGVPITPGAYDPVPDSIYLARFTPDGSRVLASTYLGGFLSDQAFGLATTPDGKVFVAGWSYSDDFPTTPGAFQTSSIGTLATDGFLTCFDPELSTLLYSTLLTGGATVEIDGLHVDSGGVATVAGFSHGGVFPTTVGSFDPTWNPTMPDLFVTRFSPDGSRLFYSTFVGGTDIDGFFWPVALDVDAYGAAVITSTSDSTDYPTTAGAFQTSHAGGEVDAVVTVLDMLPTGVTRYGSSTPGCTGPLAIGVTAMPQVGQRFGLTCTNAPPSSPQGLLLLSLGALSTPVLAKGAALWVSPAPPFLLVPVASNDLGAVWLEGNVPNQPSLAGGTFETQFFWPNPCGPAGSLSASNALAITIQL